MDSLEKTRKVVEAALDRKAEDVTALDVRELTSLADTFVVATGNSDRHVRSIADAIGKAIEKDGLRGTEGYADGRWVLIDLNDVIVHVFQPQVREFYDIERLWSDAPELELPAEGKAS